MVGDPSSTQDQSCSVSFGTPCILLAAFVSVYGSASAAQFQLSPVRVQLDARQRVDTVVVANNGQRTAAFSKSACTVGAWLPTEAGSWNRATTWSCTRCCSRSPPRINRGCAFGVLEPPLVGPEHAYRVKLQELPGAAAASGSQLKMLTKISLPVFVDAAATKPHPALVAATLQAGSLEFGVRNDGEGYLPPQPLALELRSADASVLDRQALQGNYVLAGATLPIKARVPSALCAQVASIAVVLGDSGEKLELALPANARRCTP